MRVAISNAGAKACERNLGVFHLVGGCGNAALMDGPLVHVSGLLSQTEDPKSVYCVPVGAFNLLNDFRQVKQKVANVRLECAPHKGPNDGFLQVRVSTHNGCGIGAGSTLVADFGPRFEKSIPVMTSPCKKLRGALDMLWGRPTWIELG